MTLNTNNMTYRFLTLVNKNTTTKRTLLVLLILSVFLLTNTTTIQAQSSLNKIVIDAGHGGKDPGASGKYSREKDIVLALALKTGKLLKEKYPQVEIIYTRKTDVFIPLKKRAEIANKSQADLFISIHCNSNKSSQPHGTETYVMGLHKSEANLNVAKTENAAILFEDDYQQQYDGFDPTSDESHIIFNFFQNSFQSYNLDLASKIQSQFTSSTSLRDRGVKQAGFWVLYKTTMPGVLIEAGFLSNKEDEKFLNSKAGQLKLSKAIAQAIGDYKDAHDASEKNKQTHKPAANPVVAVTPESTKKKPEGKAVVAESKTLPASTKKDDKESAKENKEAPIFKVQFMSLSTQKTLTGKNYDKLKNIESYKYKGMYRYTSGKTQNYQTAVKYQGEVRKAGFKDAFVVAFLKGERISLKLAREMNED